MFWALPCQLMLKDNYKISSNSASSFILACNACLYGDCVQWCCLTSWVSLVSFVQSVFSPAELKSRDEEVIQNAISMRNAERRKNLDAYDMAKASRQSSRRPNRYSLLPQCNTINTNVATSLSVSSCHNLTSLLRKRSWISAVEENIRQEGKQPSWYAVTGVPVTVAKSFYQHQSVGPLYKYGLCQDGPCSAAMIARHIFKLQYWLVMIADAISHITYVRP